MEFGWVVLVGSWLGLCCGWGFCCCGDLYERFGEWREACVYVLVLQLVKGDFFRPAVEEN